MARPAKKPKENLPENPGDEAGVLGVTPTDSESLLDPTSTVALALAPAVEDGFKPVALHFTNGFWCPALKKSYKPGYYTVETEQEFKHIREHADNLK